MSYSVDVVLTNLFIIHVHFSILLLYLLQLLEKEVLKNRPVDLEDFVISLCEARLQGRPIPQTAVGHNGGGDGAKPVRKNIIRIMRKESTAQEIMNRKGSLDLMGSSAYSLSQLKRGSFVGTPLVDMNAQKRGSFSSSATDRMLSFSKPPSASSDSKKDMFTPPPLGSVGDSFSDSTRRHSARSVASDDSNEGDGD